MRRLQIGMWHEFSEGNWKKYSRKGISGIEVSCYTQEQALQQAADFCRKHLLSFGIHTPIFEGEDSMPQVTSLDMDVYLKAVREVEKQVQTASQYGADYLLLHYPFPPIYPEDKDCRYWDGPPVHSYYYSENYSREEFRMTSERLFSELGALQKNYHQRIVLEYDFFGEHEDILASMFKEYPEIQLVVDTQRMEHHKRTFPGFDPFTWMDKIHPSVYLVHYSNVRFGKQKKRHIPVLPHQENDPQYGKSFTYLKYLAEKNSQFHITFEHHPELVSKDELEECYRAAEDVLGLAWSLD
ncbi:TIM barrel protein [Peribacillus kribbensis]|uniref:TIM barrel protein n=1 Tax=Peribacillus kribbensis TaxID=356658 RepID=UPI00041DA015|nr:TIM barrel protein [Peribacillus kribbensis]